MTAEEFWKKSGLVGNYEAWAFGDDPERLAELVKTGIKTATCSLHCLYEIEEEPLPEVGEYNVILNSADEAVCITRTTNVYVTTFDNVTGEHAFKEGEGDRTLGYWRKAHEKFFGNELSVVGKVFDGETKLVCEEFELV